MVKNVLQTSLNAYLVNKTPFIGFTSPLLYSQISELLSALHTKFSPPNTDVGEGSQMAEWTLLYLLINTVKLM